jgi:hypothetical protein
VVDKYEKDGSLDDFFKAHSTDWDKIDDTEAVKRNFFEENQGLDRKIVEKLWQKELRTKYNVDPDSADEDEIEENQAVLARDAKKVRDAMKVRQQEYLQPKNNVDPNEQVERIKKVVENLPETSKLRTEKKVTFDIDGQPFNYSVDNVEKIVDSLVDENVFRNVFISGNKVDTDRYMKTMAFGMNPDAMIKSFVDHGKTLARREIETELKNPSVPNRQAPESEPADRKDAILQSFLNSR